MTGEYDPLTVEAVGASLLDAFASPNGRGLSQPLWLHNLTGSELMEPKEKRRAFFFAFAQQLRVVGPILSGVVVVMTGLGLVIGRIEDWRINEALYFTFVTGLTIGYGDFTPKHISSRVLAMFIGFAGIVMTGLVAAVSVEALRATEIDPTDEK